jgi:DNA-binding transcriptional LysR family regulator
MDLRQLRTFVTVADQGTVSKAALQLHTAQPALSRQISDLERELDLKLFDRIGRRLVLTLAGEQLLLSCRDLVNGFGSLREEAQLLKGGDAGVLKVGASSIQIESVLSSFLPIFSQRYPKVQIKLVESVGSDTLSTLARGEIHACLSLLDATDDRNSHFGMHQVRPLEMLAAFNGSFSLKQGSIVDIARVVMHPLLLLDTGFVVRKKFDVVCREAKLKPNILIQSRAPHTLLALAEAGLGVAVVPSVIRLRRYKLKFARIAHKRKLISDPLAVVWDKRRVLPRYAEDFCAMLAEFMQTSDGGLNR